MSFTMELDSATEEMLNERARMKMVDPRMLAALLLADALRALPPDFDDQMPQSDVEDIHTALRRGEEDFAAGRYKSLDRLIEEKNCKFGLGYTR